jgi:hypothetical protein
MRVVADLPLVLLATVLASAGCNAILGIDDHPLVPTGSDAGGADVKTGVDADTGTPRAGDAANDRTDGDANASLDRRETDIQDSGNTRGDAGNVGPDASDAGNIGPDGGGTGTDAGNSGRDAGDSGSRILVLRGSISTVGLAPEPAGTIRLVDQGIAVPWKSCNASNCVTGGIAP